MLIIICLKTSFIIREPFTLSSNRFFINCTLAVDFVAFAVAAFRSYCKRGDNLNVT